MVQIPAALLAACSLQLERYVVMDFPIIRRARKQGDHSAYLNGVINGGIENRIPHTQERDLPGGANWLVQKFGGTAVGKFGVQIAEDIVLYVCCGRLRTW